jgi:hypothetical protein
MRFGCACVLLAKRPAAIFLSIFCRFLSEKDNPCYGVFSVLKYGPTPFGIWRTRIWKMATAEPIAAGEADGRTESPGNGAATL